jgi:hypothetical protein
MALEFQDFFNQYVKRGQMRGLFNVARSDEAAASPRYYGFINECGSYAIQKVETTAGVSTYTYYASRSISTFTTNWANRATLTYVEFHELFQQ